MAAIDYKQMEAEVDALALKYKALNKKEELSHKEQIERRNYIEKISKLLLDYARVENQKKHIYQDAFYDTNNEILTKSIKYTLEVFSQGDSDTYFKLFCYDYRRKMADVIKDYLKENRLGDYNDHFVNISANNDDDTDNVLLDKQSFNSYHAEKNIDDNFYYVIEILLRDTRDNALAKGEKYVDRTRGFWTLRFIQFEINKRRATEWEIYIILWFFEKYFQCGYDDKKLMRLMCEVLDNIKPDTLRKEFDRIIRFIRNKHPRIMERLC